MKDKKNEIPKWVSKQIKSCVKKRFTGKLTLNFYEGGIANADKAEHINPPNCSRKLNIV